jgi:hypothetical protein
MTSIFDFVRQEKVTPASEPISTGSGNTSSIFEAAKQLPEEKPRTRVQSITGAPIKGLLKGLQETYGMLSTGPIPSRLAERAFEEGIPTENKLPERTLERAGKIGSYLIGPGKLPSKLIRGGLATVGGQLAEELGFGKGVQGTIETAAFLSPTSLKGAQKYVSSLYSEAESLLPANAQTSARNLRNQLGTFITNLRRGGTALSKTAAMTKAKEIRSKIQGGNIDVKELTEFKKSINEARAGLYAEQGLDKKGKALAKRNLDELSKHLDEALTQYGQQNPQWYKPYKMANEGYGAIANSKKVSNWIGKVIKQHPIHSGAALGGALIGHALNPKALAVTGIGYGLIKSGELVSRIVKSKVLRKYYTDAIKSAMKENTPAFLNAMKKLADHFSKEKEDKD